MNEEPIHAEQFFEAMESCRPGSDDLRDPKLTELANAMARNSELRDHFDQIQQTDAALKTAFRDVPVPEGLAARLLDRLAAARSEAEVSGATLSSEAPSSEPQASMPTPKRVSRRGLLVAIAALSTAAAVLIGVLVGLKNPRPTSPSSVLEEAAQFFEGDSPQAGHPLAETPAPDGYAFSRDLLRLPQTRWRSIERFLGGPGVAYDLPPGPNGTRATLYVAQHTVPGLPTLPPPTPTWDSGCSAAAWQDGETLYVLVVEGDSRAYQGYLNLARGPLT